MFVPTAKIRPGGSAGREGVTLHTTTGGDAETG